MNSTWLVAFEKAKTINEESIDSNDNLLNKDTINEIEKDIYISNKKRSIDIDDVHSTSDRKYDSDNDDFGGFKQPLKLARYMSQYVGSNDTKIVNINNPKCIESNEEKMINTNNDNCNIINSDKQEYHTSKPERNMVEVCGKQICRAWLKHTYLDIGKQCQNKNCLRMHDIVVTNPESLYNDFSFKGLSIHHRKHILEKLKYLNTKKLNDKL